MKHGRFAKNRNYYLFSHPWRVDALFGHRQGNLYKKNYGNCGTAILHLITGASPKTIDAFNPGRDWYPFATAVRFLSQKGVKCRELTRGYVTSEPYDWNEGPIDSDHVVLASCLVDTRPKDQEASWFLITKNQVFHGKERCYLSETPLFFVNRPIQRAWLIKIPRPKT